MNREETKIRCNFIENKFSNQNLQIEKIFYYKSYYRGEKMKFSFRSKKEKEQNNQFSFEKNYGSLFTGLFTPMNNQRRR